jgi:hypothetical protein
MAGTARFRRAHHEVNLILTAPCQVGDLPVGAQLVEHGILEQGPFAQPGQHAGDAVIAEVELAS